MSELKQMDVQITPYAILAAVLKYAGAVVPTRFKLNDTDEERIVDVPVVQIEQEADSFVCGIPLKCVFPFATSKWHVHVEIIGSDKPIAAATEDNRFLVVQFQKDANDVKLLSPNGQQIVTGNPAMDKLMARFK